MIAYVLMGLGIIFGLVAPMALDIGNKSDTEISDEGQKEIFRQKTIYRVGGIFLFFLGFHFYPNRLQLPMLFF